MDQPRYDLVWLILFGCAIALIVAAMGQFRPQPPAGTPVRHTARGKTAAPARTSAPLPPVEPLIVRELTPESAREINAAVPFVTGPVPPARPFVYTGPPDERERALTCLASAMWYEAGGDEIGQQAVAQVVLNRLRHPAYPKSVCGVVFQGSERTTGCQFTFTCDGALTRRPSADAWKRARTVAGKALSGFVFKPVGTATHYHTDWVVPYWSATLDKIAMVHTHIFFRWRGWWGQPGAFSRHYEGPERLDPRIAWLADPTLVTLSPVDLAGAPAAASLTGPAARDILFIPGVPTAALKGAIVRLMDDAAGVYGLELDTAAFPGSYALVALGICRNRPSCTVMGWTRADRIPPKLPVPLPILRSVSFLYRKNMPSGREDVFWNCQQFKRDIAAQCLPGTAPEPAATPAVSAAPAPPAAAPPVSP